MKEFNITGTCFAEDHYMVDITDKLIKIRALIDHGKYFTINRARQYGKTTTLELLRNTLKDTYLVIKISFENTSETTFDNQKEFCPAFLGLIRDALSYRDDLSLSDTNAWLDDTVKDFRSLSKHISKMCTNKNVVLMIDEVDKSSNYRTYVNFLGMLRDKYLSRKETATFKSVILVGVYDIKNIKLKMLRNENTPKDTIEQGLYNSPWNIAADFLVDMSFHPQEIATMLCEYEAVQHTGMHISYMSQKIYEFTSGYPFLVSKLCKVIDERLDKNWTIVGLKQAISIVVKEPTTLFDDIFKNFEMHPDMYDMIYRILISGEEISFSIYNPIVNLANMYGLIKENGNTVVIANRIFEIQITEYLLSKDELRKTNIAATGVIRYDVIKDGQFDMELCLRKFAEHYAQIYTSKDAAFLERHARLIFITYLRPLINGKGFYHMESMLSDDRRMDLVVDFAGQQFIIELKLWYGEAYRQRGLTQLAGYLDSKGTEKGYLITFDVKKQSHQCGNVEWINIVGKRILNIII
jgi:inhibitor of KinA sporulation pathway (predicted exonuclease)